jgi:hypothetical protein
MLLVGFVPLLYPSISLRHCFEPKRCVGYIAHTWCKLKVALEQSQTHFRTKKGLDFSVLSVPRLRSLRSSFETERRRFEPKGWDFSVHSQETEESWCSPCPPDLMTCWAFWHRHKELDVEAVVEVYK